VSPPNDSGIAPDAAQHRHAQHSHQIHISTPTPLPPPQHTQHPCNNIKPVKRLAYGPSRIMFTTHWRPHILTLCIYRYIKPLPHSLYQHILPETRSLNSNHRTVATQPVSRLRCSQSSIKFVSPPNDSGIAPDAGQHRHAQHSHQTHRSTPNNPSTTTHKISPQQHQTSQVPSLWSSYGDAYNPQATTHTSLIQIHIQIYRYTDTDTSSRCHTQLH
jgi:hypothetical protein